MKLDLKLWLYKTNKQVQDGSNKVRPEDLKLLEEKIGKRFMMKTEVKSFWKDLE